MCIGEERLALGYENNSRINGHWLAPFYLNLQAPMKMGGL